MKNRSKILALTTAMVVIPALVSWSPSPATDSIILGNSLIANGSQSKNIVTGINSAGKAVGSLVIGESHLMSYYAEDSARNYSIVSGQWNTVDASNSLVVGLGNTVNSVTTANTTQSCAIGGANQINSEYACVLGYRNIVNSNWCTALGTWLKVETPTVCAVGNYNATTVAGDVFVVGTGVSEATRRNSIRATDDGSVILGSATSGKVVLAKAQGDISMGAYAN